MDDVVDAAREAGQQLLGDGEISSDAPHIVGRQPVSAEEYIRNVRQIAEKVLG